MASLSWEPFLLALQNKKHFSWKTTKLVYIPRRVTGEGDPGLPQKSPPPCIVANCPGRWTE